MTDAVALVRMPEVAEGPGPATVGPPLVLPGRRHLVPVGAGGRTGAMPDNSAFNRLLRDRSTAMLRTAFLFTGDHYLAEDLLQSALTKTYLRWGSLREEGAGEAYVRKVMASIYTRWYRRKWNSEYPTEDLPERGTLDPYPASDDRVVVSQLLGALSRRQRAVVVLRFYEDMSEKDVAETLGMSVGTVKSTTAAAAAKLRKLVSNQRPPGSLDGREEIGTL